MYRRQLAFLVLVNAIVSLVIAVAVVLVFEFRRPDPEELAAQASSRPTPILAETPLPPISGEPQVQQPTPTEPPISSVPEVVEVTPAAAAEEPEEVEGPEYIVQQGDSLLVIATRYGTTVDAIMRANNLTNPDFLFSGQRLIIPIEGPLPTFEATTAPTATPVPSGVQISAVNGAGDLATESVLVVNESTLAVSLFGWRLEREGGPSYTFGNVPLFPGGSVRVHTASGADSTIDLFWGQPNAIWQSGSIVRLLNEQGVTVFTYTVP